MFGHNIVIARLQYHFKLDNKMSSESLVVRWNATCVCICVCANCNGSINIMDNTDKMTASNFPIGIDSSDYLMQTLLFWMNLIIKAKRCCILIWCLPRRHGPKTITNAVDKHFMSPLILLISVPAHCTSSKQANAINLTAFTFAAQMLSKHRLLSMWWLLNGLKFYVVFSISSAKTKNTAT